METDQQGISLEDALLILKRRSKLLMLVTLAIFVAGAAIAFLLPSVYRSQAVILIERQEIPADLVRSTVTSFAEQRIQVISQRVMSSTNLSGLIEKFNLYPEAKLRDSREKILELMRSNIALEMISADVVDPTTGKPTEATIAFSLNFEDKSPQKSLQVLNELVSAFLAENLKSRTEAAEETTSFLDDEAESLRQHLSALEKKIAAFKDEHADSRPELEGVTREMMSRIELNLFESDRQINEATRERIYLEAELARLEPTSPDPWPRAGSASEQLRAVEAQLSAAEATYGDAHPDVIRLRKQADAMRATVDPGAARSLYEEQVTAAQAQLNSILERYDGSHPDVATAQRKLENIQRKRDALPAAADTVPSNPTYVATAARLEAAKGHLASLEAKREQLVAKLEDYAETLMSMPDAEAEYHALNRDYQNTIVKYREVSAKQMEARLSENLESERKGEKFTLIEPPLLPEEPAKPNRPVLMVLFFILSLVGGLGSVGLVEALDDKIRGRRALQEIFSAPPLASIPVFYAEADTGSAHRYMWPIGAAVSFLVLGLIAVHIAVMPLDVLWFTILRKVGL
jgi:uncharacterized protein involved in exopolysaccharide biosynthesis